MIEFTGEKEDCGSIRRDVENERGAEGGIVRCN